MPPSPYNDDDDRGSGSTSADDRNEPAHTNGYPRHSNLSGGTTPDSGDDNDEGGLDTDYNQLMNYPRDDDADYYGLLGLARNPPPSDAEIRSAYRTLTLSFHPDKQPANLREAAERQFKRIREAYETLVDPQKRTVYDLRGAEGVRQEWGPGGAMGRRGEAERKELGVKTMTPQEFRRWFLETMKTRERKAVDSLVQSRGALTIGIDASDMISVDDEGDVYFYVPSLSLSNYGIGYSFKTPVPIPWKAVSREDEATEESQGENSSAERDDSDSVEMIINAGVSGQLRRPIQELQLVYEDGTRETREVPLPLRLVARSVTLGANVRYVFGEMASAKGLLNKRPFSFLNDAGVSASAMLLPSPALAMTFAKAITPFPRTKPFSVSVSTTFSGSILKQLPEFGLKVSKEIAQRKIAYCSWSSGTLPSPFVAAGVPILTQMSKFELGFLSLPEKSARSREPDDDDEEEDEDEDEEYQEIRRKKRQASKAREVFQFGIEASPAGGSLSFNYSRNIFSGKPADEPVRSEWSSEAHYPVPPESEPRSVRLEIATTIGLDLSLGWSISGVRQVGEFTRMGLGVGVEGERGLAMTISWRRLGQKINVPIAVCPFEAVNADVAALVVIFPWVAYCAVEFGFLRPRERKRRRLAIARRRKELKKLIPKKRAESLQTIELMTEQVRRRQSKEEAQGGLVITKAEYGYIPPLNRENKDVNTKAKVIDVTIPVAALVDRSQLVIPRENVKFHIIGFYDPAPLLPKKLKIWYQFAGKQHFVEADDSEGITCPMRSHLLP